MEFMDRRGRMRPLQFWLLVNNIKDPLEDADSEPLPQHSSWTRNDIDDLSAIQEGYFSNTALDVDNQLRRDLATFLENPGKASIEQYQKARKAILFAQQSVYSTMEREDWPLFRKTIMAQVYCCSRFRADHPSKTSSAAEICSHEYGTISFDGDTSFSDRRNNHTSKRVCYRSP